MLGGRHSRYYSFQAVAAGDKVYTVATLTGVGSESNLTSVILVVDPFAEEDNRLVFINILEAGSISLKEILESLRWLGG